MIRTASVGDHLRFGAAGDWTSYWRRTVTAQGLLRLSLGIVYLWFGALKLVGMSPVLELVRLTYPPFATAPLYVGLALFELGLGIVLLAGVWKRWAAPAAVFHLIGTFGVLVSAPQKAFLPNFPFLTMEGEFVVKNLVLLAAACALWLGLAKTPATVAAGSRPHRWMLALFLVGAAGLGFAVTHLHQSLRAAAERSVSREFAESLVSAAAIRALTGEGPTQPLLVEGALVDRCRLLGCWLKLRDRTGELFVDLAPAGLNARSLPLGSQVQVSGHIGKTREGEVGYVASAIKLSSERSHHDHADPR